MGGLFTAFVFLIVLLGFWLLKKRRSHYRNLPPGPAPWPFLGNVPTIGRNLKKFHLVMQEMHKKYGKVFTLWIGPLPTIFVCDLQSIKNAFVGVTDVFAQRPSWMFLLQRYTPNIGISMASGQPWRDMRRLGVQAIRELSVETKLQEEGVFLCEEIAKNAGKPYCYTKIFQQACFNIICSVCLGRRYDYDSRELHAVMKMMDDIANDNYFFHPLNFYPVLRHLPFNLFKLKEMDTRNGSLSRYIESMIEEHERTFDPDNIRDLVDMWLQSGYRTDGEMNVTVTRASLRKAIQDLFSGATETPSASLVWLLLFMLHYPDVQARCHQEIHKVIGTGRVPRTSDRADMPFVDATIHEMLRLCSVAPCTLPHESSREILLEGYRIPPHTLVMANMYSVHRSSQHWSHPDKFDPERWLNTEGNFEKKDGFLPFSIGPRTCPGEPLAKNELFILFTTLLLRFRFVPANKDALPSTEGFLGVTISPRDFRIIAIAR